MKTFLVGGAVRDLIMNIKVQDRDWVIVGASQNEIQMMVQSGYTMVGDNFPVMLHPDTNEEYALARIEKKNGNGYTGFDCETYNVTLEQDLMRRDLTMNAIALDEFQTMHDPFNGQQDIKNKIIRHVSDAFKEDPVRLLRVARFAARFNFEVAPETMQLMREMVDNGEVSFLQKERVILELQKSAQQAIKPSKFIEVLIKCGAWFKIFPEINEPDKYHLYDIDKATQYALPENKFSTFMAMLLRETHYAALKNFQARIVLPTHVYAFVERYMLYSGQLARIEYRNAQRITNIFDKMNIQNNGKETMLQRLVDMLFFEYKMTRDRELIIMGSYQQYNSIDVLALIDERKMLGLPDMKGSEIGEMVHFERVKKITLYLKTVL